MNASTRNPIASAAPRNLRVGAFLIGLVFLFLVAIDFFITHPPFTPVQLLTKVYLGVSGLLLIAASSLPAALGGRVLRPALVSAFAFLGLIAAGLVYRLALSLIHADGMAPFLLTLLLPATAIACFAFFIWRRLKPITV
jgi:hypothetical protein